MDKLHRNSKALLVGLIVTMALASSANAQCCGGGEWTSGPSFLGTTPIVCPGNLPDNYFDGDEIEAQKDVSEDCNGACLDGNLDVNSSESSDGNSNETPNVNTLENSDEILDINSRKGSDANPNVNSSENLSQADSGKVLDENLDGNPRENLTFPEMIIPPEKLAQLPDFDKYVLAYTSNTPSDLYIKGTVALPSKSFVRNDGSLKSVSSLAEMLGRSGISEDDTLVVYGNCLSCGDPTFVFWAMKYLGHDNVWLLEGTKDDWKLAGLPLEKSLASRSSVDYLPDPNPLLFSDYEYVLGGGANVVDARSASDFSSGHIEGSFNLAYDQVLKGDHIKDPDALESVFSGLDRGRPVVIYSKNGGRASIVWFALKTAGYDARLYAWKDWLAHLA